MKIDGVQGNCGYRSTEVSVTEDTRSECKLKWMHNREEQAELQFCRNVSPSETPRSLSSSAGSFVVCVWFGGVGCVCLCVSQ